MTESNTLPNNVILKDQRLDSELSRVADELMELRWHWTLDKSNAKRVSISQYAREVGRARQTISRDANAWAEFLEAKQTGTVGGKSPEDFRQMANLTEEKKQAAEAISRNTGKSISTVSRHHRNEVDAVVNSARERAEQRKTSVSEEIEVSANWREKARRSAEKAKKDKKRNHTNCFLNASADLGTAVQRLRKVLSDTEDVVFTDNERELLTQSISKVSALLKLVELRITGEVTDIDWDTELQKITD